MRWVDQIHNEHLVFFSIRISHPTTLPVLYCYEERCHGPHADSYRAQSLPKSQIPRFVGECRCLPAGCGTAWQAGCQSYVSMTPEDYITLSGAKFLTFSSIIITS